MASQMPSIYENGFISNQWTFAFWLRLDSWCMRSATQRQDRVSWLSLKFFCHGPHDLEKTLGRAATRALVEPREKEGQTDDLDHNTAIL